MKEEKNSEENTHEKFFWIIGIAVIIFMILLFGSLIGLKITRDKIGNLSGLQLGNNGNYEVLEDGTMRNTNKDILRKEIDVDNVRFSHFTISQRNEKNGEDEEMYDTDISFEIENMNEEIIESALYIVSLTDSSDNELINFSIQLDNLPAREPIVFRQNLTKSCVDTANIDIKRVK